MTVPDAFPAFTHINYATLERGLRKIKRLILVNVVRTCFYRKSKLSILKHKIKYIQRFLFFFCLSVIILFHCHIFYLVVHSDISTACRQNHLTLLL